MRRLYLYKFLIDFWVIVPVIVPFYYAHGLSATQILTVQAAFSLSQLIFEIPSGYFSDVFGRRITLITAALLMCLGVGIYAFCGNFYWFILAESILGIAGAMRSGTDSALLYDFLKETRNEHQYKIYEGRAEFWCRMGTAISSVAGGLLGGFVTLRLPFYANMISACLLAVVGFSLKEPFREKRPQGNPLREIARVSYESILHPKRFAAMVQMAMIFSTGVTAIWGYFLIYRQLDLPVWSHGIFFAVMQTMSALCARNSVKFEQLLGQRNLRAGFIVIGLLFVPIGLATSPVVVLALVFLHAGIWGMSTPYLLEKIQSLTESDLRATTLSVGSMIGRVFAILWFPAFGWLIDHYSITVAFLVMTGVFYGVPSLLTLVTSRFSAQPRAD